MKTNRFYAAIIAVCALAMTCLMSCDPKQPEPDPQPQKDLKPAAAFMVYDVKFDSLTLEIFTVSYDYYDKDGVKQTHVIDNPEWTLRVQTESLPAKLGYHLNLAKKEGVDLSKYERFKVAFIFTETFQFVNAAGEALSQGKHYNEGMPSQGFSIDKIDEYLANENVKHLWERLYLYKADGTTESLDWN